MFNQLRIGFDVDDVVNNFMDTALSICNERMDKNLTLSTFTEYGIDACVDKPVADVIHSIFLSDELWERITPATHAQNVIKDLVQRGHQIYFVSACCPSTHKNKSVWLNCNFPFVPAENHIYTYYKGMLNLDILVDDNPDHFKRGAFTRVLVDKPWNKDVTEFRYEYRIKDLSELKSVITKEEQ